MIFNQYIVLAYGLLCLLALALAVWKRKSFPLSDALAVMIIVGFGFTCLVHFIVPPPRVAFTQTKPTWTELGFTAAYLVLVAVYLAFNKPIPAKWKGHFLKEKIATVGYKLLVFVLIPIAALRIFWGATWTNLGFAAGDLKGQLLSAGLLILLLGGFNLLVGGGAAPVRARQYSARQVIAGFGLTLLWNIIEVGLVEEFFFRAFLQTRLIAFFSSPSAGICAASLLFGLAHAPSFYLRRGDEHGPLGERPSLLNTLLYAILAISPTGWFTGLLYWRTQSLLAPILVHAAVDAVAHLPEFIEGLRIRR